MKIPIVGRTFTVTEIRAKVANSGNDTIRTEEIRLYRYYKDASAAMKAVETALKESGRIDTGDTLIQAEITAYKTEKREMPETVFIEHSDVVSCKDA